MTVRPGDRVRVQGQWRQMLSSRMDRFPSGGSAVVLVFTAGHALRVPASQEMAISR
ncbi:hypothetical protein PZB75_08815 [Streptomyces sp. AM 4-1-1]|uniref:hypothetical protein n=1 Tax=Streptomyces sp. AM 4-1-1 TaxID=3028710 RepID=UPI0023B912F6|nr:hypothetical protein [Streptomyces sp. AM 4-1-1]WEH33471.1 hypothetical protein PZB75_08815 [Streptomyces sp. AM 4-1-1]